MNYDLSVRRPLVVIESPFRGMGSTREEIDLDILDNLAYARAAMRDSISRDECPTASHLLYTQPGILDDSKPEERALGMALGLLWLPAASYGVFYTDKGWSQGMLMALHDCYRGIGFDFRIRSIFGRERIKLPKSIPDTLIAILISQHCEE